MAAQFLKFADSLKTQKSKYFEKKTFFLQIKKLIHLTLKAVFWPKKKFFGRDSL